MEKILSEIRKNYKELFSFEKNNFGALYRGIEKDSGRDVLLKIYDKNLLEKGKKDFLLKQIEREEKLTKICKNENILEFYERNETQNAIILKYEPYECNLMDYLYSNGEFKHNEKFFKNIVQEIAKALKVLHNKKIIHRDIKPNNIFLIKNESNPNDYDIKLGNFSSAILINENDYKQIGTIMYTPPEIFKNLKYSEKVDLWSLGITLYYIYFGMSPYGLNVNLNLIKHTLYGKKLIYLFSNIPNLDILFKKLMIINPNERMSHEEFFDYVLNEDFMDKNIIFINNQKNKYKKVLEEIETIKKTENYQKLLEDPSKRIKKEKDDKKEQYFNNLKKIIDIVSVDNIPGLMNFAKGDLNQEIIIKYNNIVYYDENIDDHMEEIHEDSDLFERNTQGAFLLCTNIDSFNLLMEEISKECADDVQIEFNLIVTGSKCEKVMENLKKNDNDKYFKNVCIYCNLVDKHSHLKKKYSKIYDIYDDPEDVVEYIKKFSSEKIKPFRVTKLVTYFEYQLYYFAWHKKIAEFYGDLNPQSYNNYIEKMETLINEEDIENLKLKNKSELIESFKTFNLDKDLEELDKKIINEYTKESYYGDINKWLMNFTINSFEEVCYFTSRLMYSLNKYANDYSKYCSENNKQLYRGTRINYSSLLAYERAIGKIIILSAFTSSSVDPEVARDWSGRNDSEIVYDGTFSVIFYITNKWKNNWISNGIDINELSDYKDVEKEVLFQPFSFYYVKDVKFNIKKYYVDIYLETIGKIEILENAIHNGKKIEYINDLKLIKVKI